MKAASVRCAVAHLCLAALMVLALPSNADEPAKRDIERYASRLFLADGRVVDVVGTSTLAIPSGESSDVVALPIPSGRTLQASSRSEPVWQTFEVRLSEGDVSLTLRGTMGFGMFEKLPDGLMLRLKDTTYRWLAYPAAPGSDGAAAKKRMQAAVAKLPQDFLSDLALFSVLPATGLETSGLGLSHLYMALTELLTEGPPAVNVTATQHLEPEAAARLLEGK